MSKFILSAFADEIDQDLKTQMDVLEKYGVKYIEMREVNGKNLVDHTLEEVLELKKEMDQRGFKLSAIGSPIGKILITDDFEPHLEKFKHTIEIAKLLETKYIRMFSFYIPKGKSPDDYRAEVIRRWTEFVKVAEGADVVLLHENEKEIYGDTAQRCLDLLETMRCSYVKAVFDPANFVQCDVKTYPEAYNLLENYVVYMHIKDAVFKDHHVVPAGEGDGKVKDILTQLHNKNFEGFLSLEPHLNSSLPGGGPELFGVACNALKKILFDITGTKY
jgi:sugar phosphate isomerase/epimerase